MQQNIVSAELTEENITAINNAVETIKSNLPFLISLSPSDRQKLVTVGNAFKPFVEKTTEVLKQHPDIIPGVFDKDEYLKDVKLSNDLTPVFESIKSLFESIDDTLLALRSDSLHASLDIYSSVKATKNLKPGMDVVYADLKKFFPRKRLKAEVTE